MSLGLDSPFWRPEVGVDKVLFMRADFEHEVHIVLRRFIKCGAPLGGAGRYCEEKDE